MSLPDDPAVPLPPPRQRRYNEVYEKLVREPGDLVGMIAYALYKDSKRDWILRFEKDENRRPDEDETFRGYVRAQGDRELDRLRNQAEDLLAEYSGVVLEEAAPRIREQALQTEALTQAKSLHSQVERNTRWYMGIGANVAGAFLYSVLLVILVLILRWVDVDILGLLEKASPSGQPGT